MCSDNRGFTLIETLIATGIMVTALVAVAAMFLYAARTNIQTEQTTTGILLAHTKLEDLRSTQPIDDLTVGGGLDPSAPTAGFFEYVSLSSTGIVTADTVTATAPYLRLWQVAGTNPRLVTVTVYAQNAGVSGNATELIRATTEVTNGF